MKLSKVINKGIVTKVFGLYYCVKHSGGVTNCFLQGKLKRNPDSKGFTNPVAVGDFVEFEFSQDGQGTISSIVDRRNFFSRKEKGRNTKEDIIASNLDQVVVIQAVAEPQLNLRFVDRIAVRARKDNIDVLLCINKTDLASREHISYIKDYYKNSHLDYILVSALENKKINELEKRIRGRRSLLIGYSGVGKTSLINSIFPDLDLKTSQVSESSGKGRHTTTNVIMHHIDDTELIDTPGVREFGITGIEPHMLDKYFYEFSDYLPECSFKTCTHDHEPGCHVKKMVDEGVIYEGRYISYLNILESIRDQKHY
ncbi:MAG: ribosome small subunit-dependent GTPase A [Spirochaetes bacterium]|nr:ribosome small subunit-dependent GTPase A [Spirochaetota bacterium]